MENCHDLILFTSESCNLQCKYCEMAQHVSKMKHAEEAKNVKRALEDGTYLKNLKNIFKKLNLNPYQIENVELWGQEPTLTLGEFNTMFPEFYKYYPNIKYLMFSTNGVAYKEKIINFINTLSNTINKDLNFSLQFSYDGNEDTLNSRGVNSDIIINNIKWIINELNKIKLSKYLHINIQFHYVISDTIFKKYSLLEEKENLFKFLNEFEELYNLFKNLNLNSQVNINPWLPGIINPFNASQEEGKQLALFFKNCEEVGKNLKFKTWREPLIHLKNIINDIPYKKFIEYLDKIYHDDIQLEELIAVPFDCHFSNHVLKVRYDGTLIPCQNALGGLTLNEIEGKSGLQYEMQKQKILHHFYPNVISDNDIILNNYFNFIEEYSNQSFPLYFSQNINLMILLLKNNQIDKSYCDLKKLLYHAYILTISGSCPWNNLIETGSLIGQTAGKIRFYCNGYLDLINSI